MHILHMRILLLLLWSETFLGLRDDAVISINAIPKDDNNLTTQRVHKTFQESVGSTRRWHRACKRATTVVAPEKGNATGVFFWKAVKTLMKNINTTSFRMNMLAASIIKPLNEHEGSSNLTESGMVNSHVAKTRQFPRWHREEKLASVKPASMETPGDAWNFTKPISLTSLGHKSHRLKRDAVHHQEKTLQSKRKKRKIGAQWDTMLGAPLAMGEPMPRPLAINQSTDFPFDVTQNYDLFTFPDYDHWVTTTDVSRNTEDKKNESKNPFYPITSESYGAYAVACVSVIIFTVGIVGNIATMCIVCHNYYMRSISNSLLANLALWDFVLLIFCLPLVVYQELTKDWLLGEFSCKTVPYVEVVSLGVTTFTLCALCIDRFRAATNVQIYYETMENCASTAAKLAVIWVGALLLALPELIIHQLVLEEGASPDALPQERCVVRISPDLPDTIYILGLTYDGARLWWYFGCYFCLPTLFTIGSSLATARKIRRAEKACTRGNKEQVRLESQMNCAVVALAILYGLCVIPENARHAVSAYMAVGVPQRAVDLLRLASQLLLFFRAAATPALLFCLCRPFSRAFLECCCCCCCRGNGGPCRPSDTSEENDREHTTELELSPFSSARPQTSAYTTAGSNC
ncbi:hypothetical protein AGOR_G00247550 [Albula goreensis]|uniref:G-protein coupled receptors family 1 profile domain-containing protein n=1 Tax=Albula goreensis TaxID=1534307 RepID=A0A8T3CGG0_9TELE|nr:hypothetical protein AGOR_G00247550 [Albula goreensis]